MGETLPVRLLEYPREKICDFCNHRLITSILHGLGGASPRGMLRIYTSIVFASVGSKVRTVQSRGKACPGWTDCTHNFRRAVIFDDLVSKKDVWAAASYWPRRRAEALIERYQRTFPTIHYDLFWETRLLNAQAFISGLGRCVRLYGGLGRHRRVGIEGLAFALAHETGHHLGGPPRHPFYASLSSERRASELAINTGLQIVFGFAVGQRYARHGLKQLAGLWPRHVFDLEPFDFRFPQ